METRNENPNTSESSGIELSSRELDVLYIASRGRTREQIAAILFVSKRTVDLNMKRVFGKLQVTNVLQACRKASRLGLIPFEPSVGPTGGPANHDSAGQQAA